MAAVQLDGSNVGWRPYGFAISVVKVRNGTPAGCLADPTVALLSFELLCQTADIRENPAQAIS